MDVAESAWQQKGATLSDKVRAVLRTKVRGFLDHPEATRILLSFFGQEPRFWSVFVRERSSRSGIRRRTGPAQVHPCLPARAPLRRQRV